MTRKTRSGPADEASERVLGQALALMAGDTGKRARQAVTAAGPDSGTGSALQAGARIGPVTGDRTPAPARLTTGQLMLIAAIVGVLAGLLAAVLVTVLR